MNGEPRVLQQALQGLVLVPQDLTLLVGVPARALQQRRSKWQGRDNMSPRHLESLSRGQSEKQGRDSPRHEERCFNPAWSGAALL